MCVTRILIGEALAGRHHHACGSSAGWDARESLCVRVSVHGRVRMSTYACMCECGGRTKALVAVRALRRTRPLPGPFDRKRPTRM